MPANLNPKQSGGYWLRIFLRCALLLSILLAGSGFLYENISEARDRRFHPMPGDRIDVGGYKLHINCTGQGTPSVILESGLGDSFVSWSKVQPQVATFTRVCSYDRAGTGYSDSSPRPRTSSVMAEELHTLLQNGHIAPPYLLVGHAMGGFNVRLFAYHYPAEVTGIVLLDSAHPEQEKRLPQEMNDLEKSWMREQEFLTYSMPLGIPRLMGLCGTDARARAADCNYHSYSESLAASKAFSISAAQASTAVSLGDIPLEVLSHDPDRPADAYTPDYLVKPVNAVWQQMQQELAHLSSRSSQMIAKNSGLYIQVQRSDLVIEAIRTIMDQRPPLRSNTAIEP